MDQCDGASQTVKNQILFFHLICSNNGLFLSPIFTPQTRAVASGGEHTCPNQQKMKFDEIVGTMRINIIYSCIPFRPGFILGDAHCSSSTSSSSALSVIIEIVF